MKKFFAQGLAYFKAGRYDAAIKLYESILVKRPQDLDAHYMLGESYLGRGGFAEARRCFLKVEKAAPNSPLVQFKLGIVSRGQCQYEAAANYFRRALALKPDYLDAEVSMGHMLENLGYRVHGAACYKRALQINPDQIELYSPLLYIMNSNPCDLGDSLEIARSFGVAASKRVKQRFSTWRCSPQPDRLRVGLVSGDLREHPVGFFLENLLSHLNPNRIELFAYSTHIKENDELTARIKPIFSEWKEVESLEDAKVARMIYEDGIHLLLDLSGHSCFNRLPVFSWKPAPVQASWLGYFATTGIAEIDYLLADRMSVPREHRDQFTEKICYLPDTRLCFSPPDVELEVSSLPALRTGHITFGCFQDMPKISDDVLATWGEILGRVPGSRLRLQNRWLREQDLHPVITRLNNLGIDSQRVTLHGLVPRNEYLQAYSQVDLLLDTFPYPGGTTTCEALWMGVPTVTLGGASLLARQGGSMMTVAGLADWVADSKAEYIEKAVAFAEDVQRLATLRATLRRQVAASPLFDAPLFARNLEDALWGMWREYEKG